MKKTIGTIISALIITLISTICAFAATPETIDWVSTSRSDYTESYVYGGYALETGRTDITNNTESDKVYYDFNAEKSGYYYVDTVNNSLFRFPETTATDKVYGYLDSIMLTSEQERVFYVNAGKTVIGVDFGYRNEDEIVIMYCGEEIVDYTIEESELTNLVVDYDVFDYSECDCCEEWFWVTTDSEITFSYDITLEAENLCINGTKDNKLTEGKNTATLNLLGKEKKVEYTAYYIESIVESVELTNIEEYLDAEVAYYGYYETETVSGETLTVYFKDGTSFSEIVLGNSCMIELPGGNTVNAYVGKCCDEDDYDEYADYGCFFGICIANEVFEKHDFNLERKSLDENLQMLNENNLNAVAWSKIDFFNALDCIETDPEESRNYLEWSAENGMEVFSNTNTFIKFYLTAL